MIFILVVWLEGVQFHFDFRREWENLNPSKPNPNSSLAFKSQFHFDFDSHHESNASGNTAIPIPIAIHFVFYFSSKHESKYIKLDSIIFWELLLIYP